MPVAAQARTAQSSGKTPARKTASKSTTAEAKAKKSPAKAAPGKATSASKNAATKAGAKPPASKASATKTAVAKTAAAKPAKAPAKSRLSAADLAEFNALITAELARVRGEYDSSMVLLDELKNAGQDSSGDDPADAGAKTFEREQEMSLANNRLDLMAQMDRALARIAEGTYGVCESCGGAIPKGRLQAFPQATLCVACKSREERR